MGNCEYDAKRRRMNEETERWATRRRTPWSPQEDEVILNEWVLVAYEDRDEMGIARRLSRTLFACQGRAEHLRGVLDFAEEMPKRGHYGEPSRPVCDRCFMEITPAGTCNCTD